MICLPRNTDISGLGADTVTPRPRSEILPGMNAAIKLLPKKSNEIKPPNLFEKVVNKVWQLWGKRNVRYGAYGVAGLAAVLLGRKLLKK